MVLEEDFAEASAIERFTVVAGGDWTVADGALELTNPGRGGAHGNLVVHELEHTGDFVVEVDCTLVSPTSDWGDLSVIFGYQDVDNYHYVSLNQRDTSIEEDTTHGILSVSDGATVESFDFASAGLLAEGVTYRLRIVRSGELVEVFQDGVSLGGVAIPGVSSGRFGLGSRNDGVRFSRLVVTGETQSECPCVACVEICGSGFDEDRDGATDCEDDDCFGAGCPEICSGGLDEDGDGVADCADSDCAAGCTACGGLDPFVSTLTYPDPLAIHWVSEDGTASWAASTSPSPLGGSAASSLSEANANVRPGDLVFMRAGAYRRAIAPASSGVEGAPIVFRAFEEEEVVFDGLSNCVTLIEANYIIVAGISCFRTTSAWVQITGGSYNEIWNSSFETAMNWSGIGLGGHHHRVVGNTFQSTCARTTNCPGNPDNPAHGTCLDAGGPADLIYMRGDNHLIEANQFSGGLHYAITSKGSYDIFRGNLFHNRLHGNLALVLANKRNNIVENNRFFESGIDRMINYCGQGRDRDMPMSKQNQYGTSGTQYTIVRGNVFVGGGVVGTSNWLASILDQRVYGNTFYRNHVNYQMLGSSTAYRYDGDAFVNNILARAVEREFYTNGPASSGNMVCGNNIWNVDGATISLGANDTCGSSNLNVDPEFVLEAPRAIESDLRLGPSSPMLDAGRWLTTVTSAAGSGNEFRVSDARFFSDGYGMIPGDVIQLEGDTRRMRIQSVNYDSGTIVVDGTISWTPGQGVSLPYFGAAPDIGAHERCE